MSWDHLKVLNSFSVNERVVLKEEAIDYLLENPMDTTGCAKFLAISFEELLALRKEYLKEFTLAEQTIFANCERIIAQAVTGADLKQMQVTTAKWVLERRTQVWKNRKAVEVSKDAGSKPTGEGAAVVNQYLENQKEKEKKNEDNDEVPTRTIQ